MLNSLILKYTLCGGCICPQYNKTKWILQDWPVYHWFFFPNFYGLLFQLYPFGKINAFWFKLQLHNMISVWLTFGLPLFYSFYFPNNIIMIFSWFLEEKVDHCYFLNLFNFFLLLALTLSPQDTKALFRRCQGYEGINEIEKAYNDATILLKMDPKNTAVQKMMQRISPLMQQTVSYYSFYISQTLMGDKGFSSTITLWEKQSFHTRKEKYTKVMAKKCISWCGIAKVTIFFFLLKKSTLFLIFFFF